MGIGADGNMGRWKMGIGEEGKREEEIKSMKSSARSIRT
jgi:hypothetical protein